MKYFDIHSHLHSGFFKENTEEIFKKMIEQEIGTILVGVDFLDSEKAVILSKNQKDSANIWACIGQHPVDNKKEIFKEEKYQELLNQNREKIVAIGECGLDYFWLNKDLKGGKISEADFAAQKQKQKKLFEQQINFALKNNLPLMLHVRSFKNADAHKDTLKILDKKQAELKHLSKVGILSKKIKANFHFFTENLEITKEIIKRGYYFSFPGVITFANLDEVIKIIPLEKIMSETDSPFATPVPYRGKINNPTYVKEIVKKIALVKNISENKCQKQLLKNTKNFFNLKKL